MYSDHRSMKPKRCRVARCYGNKVELVELGGAIQTFKMSNTHQQLLQECLTVSGHVETCCLIRRKNSKIKATSFGYEVAITYKRCYYT